VADLIRVEGQAIHIYHADYQRLEELGIAPLAPKGIIAISYREGETVFHASEEALTVLLNDLSQLAIVEGTTEKLAVNLVIA